MTKLQKRSTSSNLGEAKSPLDAGVPYESLKRDTQQPIPVITAVLPSSYNDFAPTNPFSSRYDPQAAHSSPDLLFSPDSPFGETESMGQRNSKPQVVAPEPQRAEGNRRSVDLRRLDGQAYVNTSPNHHAPKPERPQKPFKVAKDMYDGALPPTYKRQASDPAQPGDMSTAPAQECSGCGKKMGHGHNRNASCSSCGKRRTGAPEVPAAPNGHTHTRSSSETTLAHRPRSSSMGAGAGAPAHRHGGRPCCNKCGRSRRPGSESSPPTAFPAGFTSAGPSNSAPFNSAQRGRMGLAVQPSMPANNPAYPQIDIIPPSATSYKPGQSPFSPGPTSPYGGVDDSPLVTAPQAPEPKHTRKPSLLRSLSRKLSRRDKKPAPGPLPSQQLPHDAQHSGAQSAGRLINMINGASGSDSREGQYSKVHSHSLNDRPGSPFSYMGGADEEEAFELTDTRNHHSSNDHGPQTSRSEGDWDKEFGSEHLDVVPRRRSADQPRSHLTVEDAERPQITRFKSLRVGVHRAASVSRATSLKRLNSLKTAHHVWYRDDMAIEGATGDHEPVIAF